MAPSPSSSDSLSNSCHIPPPAPSGSYVVNQYAHMTRGRGNMVQPTPLAPVAYNHERNPGPSLMAEENVPNRFELFLLGDGEKKVTEETDTRIPDASVFTFNKEDHTLGNVITSQLHHSQHVLFAGYKVPHPLESKFILRVQTDGSLTPRAAVIQACRELVHDYALFNQEFTKEWELRKMVGADSNGTAAQGNATDGLANLGGAANGGTE